MRPRSGMWGNGKHSRIHTVCSFGYTTVIVVLITDSDNRNRDVPSQTEEVLGSGLVALDELMPSTTTSPDGEPL